MTGQQNRSNGTCWAAQQHQRQMQQQQRRQQQQKREQQQPLLGPWLLLAKQPQHPLTHTLSLPSVASSVSRQCCQLLLRLGSVLLEL